MTLSENPLKRSEIPDWEAKAAGKIARASYQSQGLICGVCHEARADLEAYEVPHCERCFRDKVERVLLVGRHKR